MTRILSWNIQNGRGQDKSVSLARIAQVIRTMGMADVICLQEVSRGLDLGAGVGAPDQVNELSALFPAFESVFGAAVDVHDAQRRKRWQFGNLLLSRLPLISVLTHPLPRPAEAGSRHMTRVATEAVVETPAGPLRVVNLHLEFHSVAQRIAQVERLRDLQSEALEEARQPPRTESTGPYRPVPRPVDAVYCGDFNMAVGCEEYRRLLAPLQGEARPFSDAWRVAHPGSDHAPTCGIYDHAQWPQGPHCRDYFFVAGRCVSAVRGLEVNTDTDASDHQPLAIELSDSNR